jgi:D-glycero-D-manno-heptose 1,7-bisphosphate phosphatase
MIPTARRFVLLDRDGTINAERNYLSSPGQLSLLPGAAAGLRALRGLGLGLVVVTNQSGVARGYFDEGQLTSIHERLHELLGAAGVELDGIYYCPHAPDDGCACRKPREGLALSAARELGFRPEECFVIGDKACDIELGNRLGATTVLVRTGHGEKAAAQLLANPGLRPQPDQIVPNLIAAAKFVGRVLRSEGGYGRRAA